MKNINAIEFRNGSKEELLPGFAPDFPYIASYAEPGTFHGHFVPWHWHKEVELFYMESGVLEYHTPGGTAVFPAGSGGLVNSNVLHMTKPRDGAGKTAQIEHIFDLSLIGGWQGSRIEQRYLTPIVSAPQIEIIPVYPENPKQEELLDLIRKSFELCEDEYAFEVKLRAALSEIWCGFLELCVPMLQKRDSRRRSDDKIKLMMIYIHEHYAEKLAIGEIAAAAFVSERECYRVFQECLHLTPMEYLKNYRLQEACRMLAEGRELVTQIGHACGLGSSSYFGKVFRENNGCSPMEYRLRWQDRDRNGQK